MVAISTILLVANLAALIFNHQALFSFWWNALAYLIECGIYFMIVIIVAIIGGLSK